MPRSASHAQQTASTSSIPTRTAARLALLGCDASAMRQWCREWMDRRGRGTAASICSPAAPKAIAISMHRARTCFLPQSRSVLHAARASSALPRRVRSARHACPDSSSTWRGLGRAWRAQPTPTWPAAGRRASTSAWHAWRTPRPSRGSGRARRRHASATASTTRPTSGRRSQYGWSRDARRVRREPCAARTGHAACGTRPG
mmetsp:Transcript_28522/g.59629  ORF Transcript_28522/g.59629 Transcript_28522/m.59629 type:complete len:202 (-) Transcript_28522:616-1221(-)